MYFMDTGVLNNAMNLPRVIRNPLPQFMSMSPHVLVLVVGRAKVVRLPTRASSGERVNSCVAHSKLEIP